MIEEQASNLLEELREAKVSRSPLKQEILMVKSIFDKIFIFEGVTDYGVYDEWLKNEAFYTKAGHITGKGKKQLVDLYKRSLAVNDSEILESCKFYVDQDFDLECMNDNSITTLKCYSVENYIVNEFSLRSFLKDEFRLDARWSEQLEEIIIQFKTDISVFNSIARALCLPLFLKHNVEGKARFYDKISSVIHISYCNVHLKDDAEKIEYDCDMSDRSVTDLVAHFENISDLCSIRGKYHFEFFKIWLSSLRETLKRDVSFRGISFNKDPMMLDMRRLASASPIPNEIRNSLN